MQGDGRSKFLPLHHACAQNCTKIVDLLLARKGKEQRLHVTAGGSLPLHAAVLIGAGVDVVPALLMECAAEQTRAQTLVRKHNALMLAARNWMVSVVKSLLAVEETLAEQLQALDSKGHTAIDYANQGGNADIIRMIETAMQTLSIASSSSSSSSSSTATTPATAPRVTEPPVPLTPAPTANFGFSDTEDDVDQG